MHKNRTTIVADHDVLVQLRGLAQRQGVSFSEVVRCALEDYVARHEVKKGRFSCLGVGSSGAGMNLSEKAEELLFQRPRRQAK